jgi:deoxyadenosine/deoxycytidine kinase
MGDLPEMELNTLNMRLRILEDGDLEVFFGHNIEDDMPEEVANFYMDLLNGINTMLESNPDHLVLLGTLLRTVHELQNKDEVEFEPDEELLKAVQDRNIVPFNKKKLN